MKPKNFPARKLARQLAAQEGVSARHISGSMLLDARDIRTKKDRSSQGKRK